MIDDWDKTDFLRLPSIPTQQDLVALLLGYTARTIHTQHPPMEATTTTTPAAPARPQSQRRRPHQRQHPAAATASSSWLLAPLLLLLLPAVVVAAVIGFQSQPCRAPPSPLGALSYSGGGRTRARAWTIPQRWRQRLPSMSPWTGVINARRRLAAAGADGEDSGGGGGGGEGPQQVRRPYVSLLLDPPHTTYQNSKVHSTTPSN